YLSALQNAEVYGLPKRIPQRSQKWTAHPQQPLVPKLSVPKLRELGAERVFVLVLDEIAVFGQRVQNPEDGVLVELSGPCKVSQAEIRLPAFDEHIHNGQRLADHLYVVNIRLGHGSTSAHQRAHSGGSLSWPPPQSARHSQKNSSRSTRSRSPAAAHAPHSDTNPAGTPAG